MRKKVIYILLLFSSNCFAQTWSVVGEGVNQPGGGNIEYMDVFQNKLYICGPFTTAGTIMNAFRIACWNDFKWDSLGSGFDAGLGFCLTHSDTMLYAGGSFQSAGNVPNTYHLAKWNGSKWLSVTSNYPNSVGVYAVKYKNDLYAGGNFTQVGSLNVGRIAKWNGSAWSNMSGGVTGGFMTQITCMAVYNGELYVGGDFTFAGGKPANYIARWNGTQWDSVGSGFNDMAGRMFVDTINNLLYVWGGFTTAGGTPVTQGFAKWDGITWSNVGLPAANMGPSSFALYRGKLFLGYGSGTASVTDTILATWDGINWKRIEGPNDGIATLQVYNDKLYLGGFFDSVYSSTQGWLKVNYIASYWEPPAAEIEDCKFKVYPNPAKREITVEMEEVRGQTADGKYIARIKNFLGQNILEKKMQGKKLVIDTSNFKKGIYLVEVCSPTPAPSPKGEGRVCHTEKVVIE